MPKYPKYLPTLVSYNEPEEINVEEMEDTIAEN